MYFIVYCCVWRINKIFVLTDHLSLTLYAAMFFYSDVCGERKTVIAVLNTCRKLKISQPRRPITQNLLQEISRNFTTSFFYKQSKRLRLPYTLGSFSGRFGPHSLERPKRLDVLRRFGPKLYFHAHLYIHLYIHIHIYIYFFLYIHIYMYIYLQIYNLTIQGVRPSVRDAVSFTVFLLSSLYLNICLNL